MSKIDNCTEIIVTTNMYIRTVIQNQKYCPIATHIGITMSIKLETNNKIVKQKISLFKTEK